MSKNKTQNGVQNVLDDLAKGFSDDEDLFNNENIKDEGVDKMTSDNMTTGDNSTSDNMTTGDNSTSDNSTVVKKTTDNSTSKVKMTVDNLTPEVNLTTAKQELKSRPKLLQLLPIDKLTDFLSDDDELKPGEVLLLRKILKLKSEGEKITLLKVGKYKKSVQRQLQSLMDKRYISFPDKRVIDQISLNPLFMMFLAHFGMSELNPSDIENILFINDPSTVDKMTTLTTGMLVSKFFNIYNTYPQVSEISRETIIFPREHMETIRKYFFWSYWMGLDYRNLEYGHLKILKKYLDKEDDLFKGLYFTSTKPKGKIDNKWNYSLAGIGTYSKDKTPQHDFSEVKNLLDDFYDWSKKSDTDILNKLVENTTEILDKTTNYITIDIPMKSSKIEILNIILNHIKQAETVHNEVFKLYNIQYELNKFEKARLARQKKEGS